MNDLLLFTGNFLNLFVESAPWLLLGLLVAGIMHEWVPVDILQKHMGSDRFSAISKAAVIGAPLPLCSCGVIPAAVGLRRSGASKPATASFLVSTPETGVDSVSVSYALLGPLFAVVRPVAAIVSAIYAGLMVKWFAEKDAPVHQSAPALSSCCASEKSEPAAQTSCCETGPVKADENECCSGEATDVETKSKISAIFAFSTGKLLEDITVWLLVGLALAAVIQTWVPASFLTQWGDGVAAMLVMAVIGIPMYICATASTPVAVGFLAAGLSPGAVLVFLLAGPATNISTMGMIYKEMGRRTMLLYVFSVMSSAIGLGYGLNFLVSSFSLQSLISYEHSMHEHGGQVQAIYALCAILLAALMLRIAWQKISSRVQAADEHASCCH